MIKKLINIKNIEELCKSNCIMKDPEHVQHIINEMVAGGETKLQIISDFDFTITKQHLDNGTKMISSFAVLYKCKSMPKKCIDESEKLVHKYYPIEIDPKIPIPEKIEAMKEWWRLANELHKGFPFNPNDIVDIAEEHKEHFRDGTTELFHSLHKLDVPVLIFSAGLGDSVVALLTVAKLMMSNVKVVSNFLQYKDGLLNGFDMGNTIHTFNKNETVLKDHDNYEVLHDRTNVLLMGDSLGDSHMANGSPQNSNILKIGFLYNHIEENLPIYMDTFDIVLIDDQTMDVARAILSLISQ